MDIIIPSPEVSAQHAALAWNGQAWSVRDLGSRNGTEVGGKRLEPGRETALRVGDVITFGDASHRFTLTSDTRPLPVARAGDDLVEGTDQMLALPSAEEPEVLVVYDPGQGWVVMEGDTSRTLRDGDTVVVRGRDWTVALPETLDVTTERTIFQPTIHEVGLTFGVSADEEYVEVVVHTKAEAQPLKPRAHHYVLLTLARSRLEDMGEGVGEAEAGWVYVSRLEKMLRASSNQLYVSIHRARKEIEALGVLGASGIVERRATTRQVRIGVSQLTVASL